MRRLLWCLATSCLLSCATVGHTVNPCESCQEACAPMAVASCGTRVIHFSTVEVSCFCSKTVVPSEAMAAPYEELPSSEAAESRDPFDR